MTTAVVHVFVFVLHFLQGGNIMHFTPPVAAASYSAVVLLILSCNLQGACN
jgi:hypothetical protein